MTEEIQQQNRLIKKSNCEQEEGQERSTISPQIDQILLFEFSCVCSFSESFQNVTIEERVALLEIQVGEIEVDVTLLEGDVNVLFDEQVIQDERLLTLEEDSDVYDDAIESE